MIVQCTSPVNHGEPLSSIPSRHCSAPDVGLIIVDSDGLSRKIGAGAATISKLCEHHNSGTSELDNEAGHLYAAIESLARKVPSETLVAEGAPTEEAVDINGPLFERWTVKTFRNVYMSGMARNKKNNPPTWELANRNLAEWVFNGRKPASPQGLYLITSEARVPLSYDHPYGFSPNYITFSNQTLATTKAVPVLIHLKIRAWDLATFANITSLGDDDYARIASAYVKDNLIPVARPTSMIFASDPPGHPQTKTRLRINFKWDAASG